MTYKLRQRKPNNPVFIDWDNSFSESSDDDDPDYTKRTQRKNQVPHRKNTFSTSGNFNTEQTDVAEMAQGNVPTKRKPGRSPKRAVGREIKGGVQIGRCFQRRKKSKRPSRSASSKVVYRQQPIGKNSSSGKRSTILSWLVDLNIIEDNAYVFYMLHTDPKPSIIWRIGKVNRGGISCLCCKGNEALKPISDFKFHSEGKDNRPYEHIVLAVNGVSLVKCQTMALFGEIEMKRCGFNQIEPIISARDANDDTCMICGDGGDLICCEKCPSTFHLFCIGMESIPQGDWLCPYCVCKFCKSFADNESSICLLCGKKYHWVCHTKKSININIACNEFCGKSCEEMAEKLEKLVGVENELDGEYSWTLIRRTDLTSKSLTEISTKELELNSKISVAWDLMDQCFEPIIDRHSKVNLLQSVIYSCGSNLNRINFNGFYTAILEMKDEIVSAATVRIHGRKMAEMPFVATHWDYRGKGMLRKLMVAIESALCYLKVEKLVIPASTEVVPMWRNNFQFYHNDNSLSKEIASFNTLMFPRAVRLQKYLLPQSDTFEAMDANQAQITMQQPITTEGREFDKVGYKGQVERGEYSNSTRELQQFGGQRKVPLPFDLNLDPPPEDEENKLSLKLGIGGAFI